MARRPPKRYRPGELDATRRKLGDLSPEEARLMADRLGGEVGVEKSEIDLRKEAAREQVIGKPRNFVDVLEPSAHEPVAKFKKISTPESKLQDGEARERKKEFSYIDRVRTDFLCRRPEYNLKSVAGAVGSLFSFFLPVADYVNPAFLSDAEKSIYQPIYDLVKATRALYTKTREGVFNKIAAHPFNARILKIIKDWDVESIEQEIFHLRKRLRSQNMRNLLRLCKMVYTPIILLSRLDESKHILGAYKWAYNINIKSSTTRVSDKERLITFYYDAEKNIPVVLNNLKQMLYPVLLKRIAPGFSLYDEFFVTQRDEIISFLSIDPSDILDSDLEIEQEEFVKDDAEDAKKIIEPDKNSITELPDDVLKGLNCLEKLYPRAGWFNLDDFPDLYPYFQPIYNFPSGFELIPPTDPLHQIIVLLSILNDLFYGVRDIKFGQLRDSDLVAYNIQGSVDSLLGPWPLYIDEIISKVYISRLSDYCRQIEKDKAFKLSEVGKKIVTEMNWIKINYLLPYLSFKMQSQVVGIVKRQMPKLFVLTTKLKELLAEVVLELKQKAEEGSKAKLDSITNPWALYIFDLENNTSRRLDKLLYAKIIDKQGNKRIIDRRNNANLLFYILSILAVLDYYINTKESHLYYSPSTRIFRTIHNGSDVPQYSVETINPDEFLEEGPAAEEQKEGLPAEAPEPVSLTEALQKKIDENLHHGKYFSIVYLCLFENYLQTNDRFIFLGRVRENLLPEEDFLIQVNPNGYVVILSGRDIKQSIQWVKDLVIPEDRSMLGSGVIPFQAGWRFSYVMKVLEKTKLFTAKQGPARLVYLDAINNKFKSINF